MPRIGAGLRWWSGAEYLELYEACAFQPSGGGQLLERRCRYGRGPRIYVAPAQRTQTPYVYVGRRTEGRTGLKLHFRAVTGLQTSRSYESLT